MKNLGVQCSIPDCGKPVKSRGWCDPHYKRWRRHRDPLGGGTSPGEALAFIEKALASDTEECINWPFARCPKGYGRVFVDGRFKGSSRVVCERAHGAPPTPQHEAAHNCGKGHEGCVNPRHLRWATSTENQADKLKHGTINRGERHGHAKLTRCDVREIRRCLTNGESQHSIACKFAVSRSAIRDIVIGKSWWWLS